MKRWRDSIRGFGQYRLTVLSGYYESSETAIIEAAVAAFSERYFADYLREKFESKDPINPRFVTNAQNMEKITASSG